MRVKYMKVKDGEKHGISACPGFSVTGSVAGMKKQFYGMHALLVRCGSYIYNVTSQPNIYDVAH